MLGRLIPRDAGFFTLFNQLASHLSASAKLLSDLLAHPSRQAELVRAIKDEEHKADQLMNVLNQRLDDAFITPIPPTINPTDEITTIAIARPAVIERKFSRKPSAVSIPKLSGAEKGT